MNGESGLHKLIESLAGYVQRYGERTAGESSTGSEGGISRSRSLEAYALECADIVLTYVERKRSGMKEGEPKLYRVVKKPLECTQGVAQVIALFEAAEGNWFPNPDIKEDSLSTFGRVRIDVVPSWSISEEDNPAILAKAHSELQKKYGPLQ